MNLKIIFYSLFLACLIGCNQGDELLNPNARSQPAFRTADFGFNQKLNMVTFKDKSDVQDFINNYDSSSNRIDGFYDKGFVPFRVKDNVDEKTFNALTLKKKDILQKVAVKNKNVRIASVGKTVYTASTDPIFGDAFDNESFISDDRFASILNAEGEVIVENRVYKYTVDGLYIVDEEDKEYLNNYLAFNATGAPLPTGLSQIDSKIQAYLPPRDSFNDFGTGIWESDDPDCIPPKGNIGWAFPSKCLENPESPPIYPPPPPPITPGKPWENMPYDTNHYQNCVPDRPWIDNIFGRNYACEYYFDSKRKLRTIFAAEDYYIFFDVFAQAKFKQKTLLGWYSSRDANSVYVKINDAKMTLGDRKIQIKIGSQEVKEAISEIEKILDGSSEKKASFLSNVYIDKGSGTSTVEAYSPSFEEIRNAANQAGSLVTPSKKSLISDIRINFQDLFGKTPKKVFVVTVLGKEQSITDYDIANITAKAYKEYVTKVNTPGNDKLPAGVVILKKAMNGTSPNEEGEVVSYSFANDIVKVDGNAIASRQFNIPKQFKLESATIEFTDWKWLPKRLNIEMSWKKPQKYDVDIEAGAYYNGRWGGSKFRVIKQ
ncbi:hypothetical protein [Elizabethkingia meningoseptica]|uniref:hypothetical protein n=1 Tax=Elizabethkingia meningoseptica TaxID=238 RepID=UPI00389242B3